MCERKDASEFTRKVNEAVLGELPFDYTKDFEDAARGFIAPLNNDGIATTEDGTPVYNGAALDFVEEGSPAPATVNPSLWRNAQLIKKGGLFKVVDRLYQVRGQDLSNLTIIEGDTGLILMDPLVSPETARAALDLYFEHRPRKEVVAMIHSHSHVDHYGGVKGVIDEEDVKAGKVRVIAPVGFLEAAVSENVMAGTAMSRRAMYHTGVLVQPGPKGHVGVGLGISVSAGKATLIPPTEEIVETGQKLEIDGLTFEFLLAPDTEAPAEMHWFIEELGALSAAENCCHTLHNTYTLRGAPTRDPQAWSQYLNDTIDRWGHKADVLYAMHHWPVWGTDDVLRMLRNGRDAYRFINDQTAPRQPRLHPDRDRRDDRVPARAGARVEPARLLRDRQSQRQGDLRQVPGLVRRQPGQPPHAAAGRGLKALRRVDGRGGEGAGGGAQGIRQGRVPLGGRGGQPRRLRRSAEQSGPARCRPTRSSRWAIRPSRAAGAATT